MTDANAPFRHLYAAGAAAELAPLLEAAADACGYRLVRLRLSGAGRHAALQVLAERADAQAFSHADCARLLRALETALAASDAHGADAALEVSSPGVARPLTRAEDFNAWRGHKVRLRFARAAEGARLSEGILLGCAHDAQGVRVSVRASADDAPQHFAPAELSAAELVPNASELQQILHNAKQAQRAQKLQRRRKSA